MPDPLLERLAAAVADGVTLDTASVLATRAPTVRWVRDLLAATAPLAFRGWMLANAPAAHMLEHPVYDLRILDCR